MGEQKRKSILTGARVRHWMSGTHSPYPGMLHDPHTDVQVGWRDALLKFLWSLPEGARVSIQVEWTEPAEGEIAADDYWTLLAPHTYGHVREQLRAEEEAAQREARP